MRAYVKKEKANYLYPAEMEKILGYLTENGVLNVSGLVVEEIYRHFSHRKYAAVWMSVTPEILEEFADWMARVEI